MLAIKKYIYKTKGFTIKTKTKTVQIKLSNGKVITKVMHYDCLTDVSPEAISKGDLILPEVDSISFNAFQNIKDCYINSIVLPKGLKEIAREHHVLPFFYLKHWPTIEMPEVEKANFFTENGKLYEMDENAFLQPNTLPTSVELVYASPYSSYAPRGRASIIDLTQPVAVTENGVEVPSKLTQIKTLRINPGAYKNSGIDKISVTVKPHTEVLINSIKTDRLHTFGIPDEIVLNGTKITQSQFLTHRARMLIGITPTEHDIMVQHIDGSNDVEKYWNADEINETFTAWSHRIEPEQQPSNSSNSKRNPR